MPAFDFTLKYTLIFFDFFQTTLGGTLSQHIVVLTNSGIFDQNVQHKLYMLVIYLLKYGMIVFLIKMKM